MFCDRNEKDDGGECQRRSLAADEGAPEKSETTPLRNEAQLNCVSLRSEVDDEVTCGVSRVKMNAPSGAPLTAPQVTWAYAARKKTSIRRTEYAENTQNGGCCGSTDLPVVAPNAKFSVEMWPRPERTRKVRWAATSALTFTTFS